MIKLGLPISKTAFDLLNANALDVDYIVWYGQIGLNNLDKVAALKPIYIHDLADSFWLNYRDPFQPSVMTEARAMLDIAKSPYLSTGIGASAEPQAHRNGPYREADVEHLQMQETVTANIIKHGRRLQEWAGVPLILENFNYHPTNAYEYICEPALVTELLGAIGCDMLLDLAHARISAFNMGWHSAEEYLTALPLHKVREIHITRPGWQKAQMVDLHQPLEADDLDLLAWVIERTPVEAVTLEVKELPALLLTEQLAMLREFLGNVDRKVASGV
jgi:uncharacterized protein (UPF0276 family)